MPAYNNPNMYYQNAQQQMPQAPQAPVINLPYLQQPQQPQIQQDYFIQIASKMSADAYPVAPGSTIWMLNANEGKLYLKSRGYQPGSPIISKEFSIVEDEPQPMPEAQDEISALRQQIESLTAEMAAMKPLIDELKS